jgi:sec-independent protein translocase protein TatA
MGSIGPLEIVLLLVLALMLFGAKRLPEIGRSLGTGMREFKDSVTGITEHHTAPQPVENHTALPVGEAAALPAEPSPQHSPDHVQL